MSSFRRQSISTPRDVVCVTNTWQENVNKATTCNPTVNGTMCVIMTHVQQLSTEWARNTCRSWRHDVLEDNLSCLMMEWEVSFEQSTIPDIRAVLRQQWGKCESFSLSKWRGSHVTHKCAVRWNLASSKISLEFYHLLDKWLWPHKYVGEKSVWSVIDIVKWRDKTVWPINVSERRLNRFGQQSTAAVASGHCQFKLVDIHKGLAVGISVHCDIVHRWNYDITGGGPQVSPTC